MTNILGSASTRWTDYLGTASADDADPVAGSSSIYELSGLDRQLWTIVAVDLFVLNNPQVAVYAIRHCTESDEPITAGTEVTVTQFRITDQDKVRAFLEQAFKTVAVRLVAKPYLGATLTLGDTVRLD